MLVLYNNHILEEEGIIIFFIIFLIFAIFASLCFKLLLYFGVSSILSGIISFIIYIVCCYMYLYIKSNIQSNILDEDCDPERFLKLIDRQDRKSRKTQRYMNYIAINRAAGHMSLGDCKAAKEYLDEVDTTYLSEKDNSYLVYTMNMIGCYYALGEIEKAEVLYETNMVRFCPYIKKLKKSVEILIGERYYYLKKYNLSYEHLQKLLNYELTKRQYLGVLYCLAQMDVRNGDKEQATVKFKKIAKLGNKLWISKDSKEMIENIKTIQVIQE